MHRFELVKFFGKGAFKPAETLRPIAIRDKHHSVKFLRFCRIKGRHCAWKLDKLNFHNHSQDFCDSQDFCESQKSKKSSIIEVKINREENLTSQQEFIRKILKILDIVTIST